MFGIQSARSRSNLTDAHSSYVVGGGTINRLDYDELDALYDISREDVRLFGVRKFKALCKRDGPELAARMVTDQRMLRRTGSEDTTASASTVLDEADIWFNTEDEVEVVLGATF